MSGVASRPRKAAGPSSRRFLVITRAGANSSHEAWLEGAQERLFDLVVTEWQPTHIPVSHEGVEVLPWPGGRNEGYSRYFESHPDIFTRYQSIALIDDDIIMSADDINRCFLMGAKYELELWQPSLSWDSYFSYGSTLNNPLYQIRYTNFIEMMCPFFSARFLKRAGATFSLGYLVGIDILWPRLIESAAYRCAVVDAVIAKHGRPVGAHKRLHGFSERRTYNDEIQELMTRLGVSFRGPVVYAAVTRRGRSITSKILLSASVAGVVSAIFRAKNKRFTAARIADHARHILTRPAQIDAVPMERIEALGKPDARTKPKRA
jgi:hypothetical protein